MVSLKKVKWRQKSWLWLVLLPAVWLAIPVRIPSYPTSTVLNDRHGQLLSANIASDGQWRFPLADSVPYKLEQCLLLFEDEYFYRHPGINPVSLFRATRQNLKSGTVKSGASTLTMQLARMSRNRERTFWQKIQEMALALRLEVHYSKKSLLRHYASLAPFGGNVVGIEAASWRYYGRPPHLLSWAESATLAVLPNQPAAIYPGARSADLLRKRNFLLQKLLSRGLMDSLTWQLSLEEPLPGKPYALPQHAPHLLATLVNKQAGQQITTTIDPFWQTRSTEILERHHTVLKTNGIDNAAALVVDLQSGAVLAYVGNTTDTGADGWQVDIVQRPRSSGSILKPLLYAQALHRGVILPTTLLPDVPSFFAGYSPKNFNLGYAGAVPAAQALALSLNIPFAHLLKAYTYEQFHQDLRQMGFTTLHQPPAHYGLSLILGGGEVTLWELSQAYYSLYRGLANEANFTISVTSPAPLPDFAVEEINIWHTFRAMTELSRPESDEGWQTFSSSQTIAWKTGTSFGFRDAWAVGLNGAVLVAVWAGNADGEGRAGLTGATAAGPILTELLRLSDYDPQWLRNLKPYGNPLTVCRQSGLLASPDCPTPQTLEVGKNGEKAGVCTYHRRLLMDESATYTVHRDCYPSAKATEQIVFVLPAAEGAYYRKTHSDYSGLPPHWPGCAQASAPVISMIYPLPNARVFIPRELDGNMGQAVLEASHQQADATLYWHLNGDFFGSTTGEHKLPVTLNAGNYLLKLVDQTGEELECRFSVVSSRE